MEVYKTPLALDALMEYLDEIDFRTEGQSILYFDGHKIRKVVYTSGVWELK
jgi:hypothetical protein